MSEIVVQKFGGTSVGTVDRIDSVAEIIKNASKSNKIVVVVSAETTTTILFDLEAFLIISATESILSTVPTDVPPNF